MGVGLLLLGAARVLAAEPPERLALPGIENAFRLGPRLYSGGEPRGAEAFAALKALGVKTIISVDGARPDVETARHFGIRYAHLPVGYDGVPRAQAIRIIQAARTLPGPVFVHCHHGKHRGPAAAAVCGLANEGWTPEQAVSWLQTAGTAPEYRGLYETVRKFARPDTAELEQSATEFPEQARVPALVETMVQVDRSLDRLKAIREAGFRASADAPDLDPPHEALQLGEHFREACRLPEARDRGEEFHAKLEEAAGRAEALRRALRDFAHQPGEPARRSAEAAFTAVSKSCTACHARHRDQ
jgi:protein tyrosine phosphatase (PTP) superfamily phosphohydrolase (DUF442 family)